MRFNGRYVIFTPKEPIFINLKLPDGTIEYYTCGIPVITVHNLVIGKIYIDVSGKASITNNVSGEYAEMEFKDRGWSGKNVSAF